MKLFINARSGVPIYKQLVQQIEKGIAGGILKPGVQLPTVREVALDLTINPNTVARAYRELEHHGLIESVQGRGTYIADNVIQAGTEEKEIVIRQLLDEAVLEAGQLNLDRSTVEKLFRDAMKRFGREWQNND